eukprot:TRINITY_DN18891_c0_g1_i1.p1 TRINITY_DN18891_c0_g1~~TRINITY_DN18891_c0_g1_i1.p1  ORF type:complete len:146 (+),score=25.40 TRINITY_DN18891_c0_g1_i1:357-794(+)
MKDVQWVIAAIVENSPVDVRQVEFEWEETLWSDASMKGGAFILQSTGEIGQFKWTQQGEPIHVLEARACLRGVHRWVETRERGEVVVMKTDSMLVFFALRDRKATGFIFNNVVDDIVTLLDGLPWRVEWVPTEEQLADKPSRIFT